MNSDILIRGDSRTYYVDVSVGGVPLDLTGYTAWFTAKNSPADSDNIAVIHKGTGAGGATLVTGPNTATLSRIAITIAPTDTSSLAAKRLTLYYDVQIKGPGGDIHTVTTGEILVLPDITITTT